MTELMLHQGILSALQACKSDAPLGLLNKPLPSVRQLLSKRQREVSVCRAEH